MVRLLSAADTPEAAATAVRWERVNVVRLAVAFAAWLLALRALTLLV